MEESLLHAHQGAHWQSSGAFAALSLLLLLHSACLPAQQHTRSQKQHIQLAVLSKPAIQNCMTCRTLIVREGESLEMDSLSELGIFGLYLRLGDKLLMNQEGGHLVRTKVRAIAPLRPAWLYACKLQASSVCAGTCRGLWANCRMCMCACQPCKQMHSISRCASKHTCPHAQVAWLTMQAVNHIQPSLQMRPDKSFLDSCHDAACKLSRGTDCMSMSMNRPPTQMKGE